MKAIFPDEPLPLSRDLDTAIAYRYRLCEECWDYNSACAFLEEMSSSSVPGLRHAAKSLTRNTAEILSCFVSGKTNAILECSNSRISIIKNRARGFRNPENLKNMICFCLCGFDFPFIPVMQLLPTTDSKEPDDIF